MQITPVKIRPPQLVVNAVSDGVRLGLQLNSVSSHNKKLSQEGAWWIPSRRMWAIYTNEVEAAMNWLELHFGGSFVDIQDAYQIISAAIKNPDQDYFTQHLDVQVFPLARGNLEKGAHAVSFIYDLPLVYAMRELRGKYHKAAAAWQVPGGAAHIFRVLNSVAGIRPDFIFEHEQAVILDDLVSSNNGGSPIQVPSAKPEFGASTDGPSDNTSGTGFISVEMDYIEKMAVNESELNDLSLKAGLRDYQTAGVRHLISNSSCCIADDMGLGKSRQSVVAAHIAAKGGRILIICPASLRINWEREIKMVFPDASVGMVGENRLQELYACNWVIVNYERAGGLVRETRLSFAVMLADEAHSLKEFKSGRTRNAFVLASRIPRRFVITGTPLLNRESELHTLLRITGHPLGSLTPKEFHKAFAGSSEKRSELADALKGWMIRRRKDVLTDLGTKSHQVRYISPAEGLGQYQELMADMTMQAMPKITKLRQCLEALKTQFLIETIESLQAEDKAIIFCEYMTTVTAMVEAFKAAGIKAVQLVGADTAKKRQKAIDAFQNDPEVRVFIGTTMAAGVGITLTAANYVLFASMPWTPALMRQAEDRAYRLGQKRDVIVIVPIIPNTIDEAVWEILESKREKETDVVEAVTTKPTDKIEHVSIEKWIAMQERALALSE